MGAAHDTFCDAPEHKPAHAASAVTGDDDHVRPPFGGDLQNHVDGVADLHELEWNFLQPGA